MQPTTNRAHQFGRGFSLIVALVLAQHLAVTRVMADATACPCSLFSAAINPGAEASDGSPTGVNLGIKFHSDTAGWIKAIRFYKHINNTGPHTVYLWDANGAQLASAGPLATETATGWQEVALPSPVAINANTDYVASYYAPNRAWPHNLNYFNIFGTDSAPLHVTGNNGFLDGVPRNGVFAYGDAGLFPNQTNIDHPSNYMVDVVFDTVNPSSTTGPTVVSTTPVNNAVSVDPNANIVIHFSKEIDANTINSTNIQLLDGSTPVLATVTYPELATDPTATIIPTPVLALNHAYTVRIQGGASGVKDLAGNALQTTVGSTVTIAFTTSTTMPAYGERTIWSAPDAGNFQTPDDYEATLGVKFQSDADGYIKGIRFYKFAGNTGTHHGYLWTASGTLLAEATFTNETASDWQTVRFANPVPISRHTTYIAAYYMPTGHWANTRPYFQTGPSVNFPLRGLQNFNQNGGNPNCVYVYSHTLSSGLPDSTIPPDTIAAYNSPNFPNVDPGDAPNYWIDVIFDTNSDAPPTAVTVSINDLTVTETDSGTVNATFLVTLDRTSNTTVTVNYATADSAAVAPGDYTAGSGTLTFPPGTISKSVTISVNGDLLDEADEIFAVNLTAPTNAAISDAQGLCTIFDNDALPLITIGDVTKSEGNSGSAWALFPVTLSAPSGRTVTVNYATADSTTTAGEDYYVRSSALLTFPAGTTSMNAQVQVRGDTKYEDDEVFVVNLIATVNATIGTKGQGSCTIANDDLAPTISINDISITEGNAGTTNAIFTIKLSNSSENTITVSYATANDTAVAPDDYLATSGTLTYAPGQTSKTVWVVIKGDTATEANEILNMVLSNAANATIADNTGQCTILNDD